jgi:hypothetical protein
MLSGKLDIDHLKCFSDAEYQFLIFDQGNIIIFFVSRPENPFFPFESSVLFDRFLDRFLLGNADEILANAIDHPC